MESPKLSSSSRLSTFSIQSPSSPPHSLYEKWMMVDAVEEVEINKSRVVWDFLDQQWRPFSDLSQFQKRSAVKIGDEFRIASDDHVSDSSYESRHESTRDEFAAEDDDTESDGSLYQLQTRRRTNYRTIRKEDELEGSDTEEHSEDSFDENSVEGSESVEKEELDKETRHLQEPPPLPKLKLRIVNGEVLKVDDKGVFGCEQCKPHKTFTSAALLHAHNELHHTKRHRFICPICAKVFTADAGKKRHIRKVHHIMQKKMASRLSHACQYCEKQFPEKFNRDRHELTHSDRNKNLFRCDVCSKTFTQKSNLTVHERSHTGDRPFACKFCDYTCTTAATLESHLRIHAGEKPFKCQYCPMRFSWIQHCRRHERSVHCD